MRVWVSAVGVLTTVLYCVGHSAHAQSPCENRFRVESPEEARVPVVAFAETTLVLRALANARPSQINACKNPGAGTPLSEQEASELARSLVESPAEVPSTIRFPAIYGTDAVGGQNGTDTYLGICRQIPVTCTIRRSSSGFLGALRQEDAPSGHFSCSSSDARAQKVEGRAYVEYLEHRLNLPVIPPNVHVDNYLDRISSLGNLAIRNAQLHGCRTGNFTDPVDSPQSTPRVRAFFEAIAFERGTSSPSHPVSTTSSVQSVAPPTH